MNDFLSRFDGGELIGLVSVAGGLLIAIVSIVTAGYCKVRKLALKEAMIERGLSAEDICAVLDAGTCGSKKNSKHACQS